MIWAKINNREFQITGGEWSAQLDDADTFSFSVLLSDVPDYRDLRYASVGIIYKGEILVTGEIVNHSLKRSSREQAIEVDFDCVGELNRLDGIKSKSGAHYQNSAVLSILAAILPGNWAIQQVNMQDSLIETTTDLRNKQSLMQQLTAIFSGIPNLHFRYGGLDGSGDYILQVGDFNTLVAAYTEGVNVKQITTDYTSHEVLRDIYPYGYLSSDAVITLTDLYSDPLTQTLNASIAARMTAHPDYASFPVLPDGSEFFVRNSAISIQRSTRQQYRLVKTRNNVLPTANEKAQAAYALWLSTVADLKKKTLYQKYNVQDAILASAPSVGDRAFLSGTVHEPVYDVISSRIDYIPIFEVNGDYRIVGFQTKFKLGEINGQEGIIFDVTCTDNDNAEEIDPELAMYRRLEQVGDYDDQSTAVVLSAPKLASKTHTNTDASDCTSPSLLAAKIFNVTSPAPPVGSVSVVTSVATIPSTAVIWSETPPTNPGDPWIGCVSAPAGAAWPPAAGVNVTVIVSFLFA
jgi:hypothetical protein